MTPYRKFFNNSVLKGFIATPIDALCSNFVKFGQRETGKVMRYLPDKKHNFALCVYVNFSLVEKLNSRAR